MQTTPPHIKHLYWRAGFGLSPQEWQVRHNWSREQAIQDLFEQAAESNPIADANRNIPSDFRQMDQQQRQELLREERQKVVVTNFEWVLRMSDPSASALLERMSLFWHDHFACESKSGLLATQQLNSIRAHALGSFRDLVLAMAKDPAMIRYLNNQQNRKRQPNENFARELLELFTVGRGQYSEQDIKEAARAFTGWSSNLQGQFIFRRRQHDTDSKTFMGRSGNLDGEDIIDIILEQPATANYLCRKIYAYFVNTTIDEAIVADLARSFRQSDYNIGQLMRRIFSSDWFYAPANIGSKIKSPIDLIAGMIRQLNLSQISQTGVLGLQRALGQILFKPPNVAGWPGGKSWIDNSTLMLRLNLAAVIFQAAELEYELAPELEENRRTQLRRLEVSMDLQPLNQFIVGATGISLGEFLLQTAEIPEVYRPRTATGEQGIQHQTIQFLSLPEYQMC